MSFLSDRDAETLSTVFSRRKVLAATAGGLMISPLSAFAQSAAAPGEAEITVDQARQAPIPIVVPSFGAGLGSQISSVIASDLSSTGLFKVMDGSVPPGSTPDFAGLKAQGARAAVAGQAVGSDSVRVEMRLWDVVSGQQLQGTAYTASQLNWRRIAHIIADVIYERMLGEKGYFDTRIAYIARTGPRRHQITKLALMDQDGFNQRMLTGGQWLTLTPRFNPSRDQVAFMSYANNRPRVYLFDLGSGRQQVLGTFDGISFAPRFAPDGQQVVLSATRGSGSDLYSVDLASGSKRQLTNSGGAIDTSPCYSPDGRQIVFVSDRGGSPQLYVMSASGGGAQRISYGSGQYGSPVWSPRGDLIAFTRIGGGGFSLGVMNPDGSGERILTKGFTVESPTFCPNGRVLAFCRQTASGAGGAGFSSAIGTVDITGFNERILHTGTGASDPAWSPMNG
ncbi:translocation protein TolB [Neokomagataea thailandica NBRC 106555]|uniref:Tol-Pal system protein TolB n=2 Tax=Neokomagataea TaxID=1223423 RepID=A0A4Y6V6N3_9PROT|nr:MULTISPECIES: Tol-Pal system beta propeller repeat protein TolB [Neokomagataea]QDH24310.1 Tol-Pal system protein TolB [Neokomagataea tanensis]GBR53106.1 translocation protein TolB [Neokomagataea thailandica NBRC 106555]